MVRLSHDALVQLDDDPPPKRRRRWSLSAATTTDDPEQPTAPRSTRASTTSVEEAQLLHDQFHDAADRRLVQGMLCDVDRTPRAAEQVVRRWFARVASPEYPVDVPTDEAPSLLALSLVVEVLGDHNVDLGCVVDAGRRRRLWAGLGRLERRLAERSRWQTMQDAMLAR